MSTEFKNNKNYKIQEQRKYQAFIEELSWLLASYSNLDFKSFSDYIKQSWVSKNQSKSTVDNYVAHSEPNKRFLVGALPQILMDKSLFPENEDIAEFANTIMKIIISHYEKKSRFELIGTIVCRTYQLKEEELNELVRALANLLDINDNRLVLISPSQRKQLGWNTIIQNLAAENRNATDSTQ